MEEVPVRKSSIGKTLSVEELYDGKGEDDSEVPLLDLLFQKRDQLVTLLRSKEVELSRLGQMESRLRAQHKEIDLEGKKPSDLRSLENILGHFEPDMLNVLRRSLQLPSTRSSVIGLDTSQRASVSSVIEPAVTPWIESKNLSQPISLLGAFEVNVLICGSPGLASAAFAQWLLAPLCSSPEDVIRVRKQAEAQVTSFDETSIGYSTYEFAQNGVKMIIRILIVELWDESRLLSVCRFVEAQHQAFFERQVNDALLPFHPNGSPTASAAFSLPSSHGSLDLRAHVCFFLIPPYGRSFASPLDIKALTTLASLTNLIPIVPRAECLSIREREIRTNMIRDGLKANKVWVYLPPSDVIVPSIASSIQSSTQTPWPLFLPTLSSSLPDSHALQTTRTYPWGSNQSTDATYQDLYLLQKFLWTQCVGDLVRITHSGPYLRFRKQKRDRLQRLELGMDDLALAPFNDREEARVAELAAIDAALTNLQSSIEALNRRRNVLVLAHTT